MNKIVKILEKIIPAYAVLPLISCFAWNLIVYGGSRILNEGLKHYDLTTEFDRVTPVIPEFMIVYFGCFLSWGIYYIMCGRVSKEYCARFVTFDIISRTICGIFFLLLPTFNVRPEIVDSGLFNKLLLYLYSIDAADNLFPSIHCLVSWNCFIGLRNSGHYKKSIVTGSCIIAVMVFISTLVTKQHVVVDIFGAVAVSEISWYAVSKLRIYTITEKIMGKYNFLEKLSYKLEKRAM